MDGIVERGLESFDDAVDIAGLELLLEVGEKPVQRLLGTGGGLDGFPGGGGGFGVVREGRDGDEGGGERAGQQVEGFHRKSSSIGAFGNLERVMGVGPT